MARLVAIGLIASGSPFAAAGPNDAQVLVQRNAVVQQHGFDADVSKRAGRPVLQAEGGICTAENFKAWESGVQDYQKRRTTGEQKFVEHMQNLTSSILDKHFEPVKQAFQFLLTDVVSKMRTPIYNVLKFEMIKAFKPKEKYNASSVLPDPSASSEEANKIAEENKAVWEAFITKGIKDFGATVDASIKETQMSAWPGSDMQPSFDFEKHASNLDKYFLLKVLPVIGGELFPKLAGDIPSLFDFPGKNGTLEDMAQYGLQKVLPMLRILSETTDERMKPFMPASDELPQRGCLTCHEQFVEDVQTWDPMAGKRPCMMKCMDIMNTCMASIDFECVNVTRTCLDCSKNGLASLDACEGTQNNTKLVKDLDFIGKSLAGATNPEGFDSFLGDLAKLLVSDKTE